MYLIYIPKNAITSLTFWKTNPWKHHWKTISCQSQSLYVGLLMYFSTLEYTWISCICMSDSTSQPWQMLAVSKLSQFSELLFRVWKEFSAFFSESFVTKSDVYIYIYIYLNIYQIIYCYYTCIEIFMTCYLMDTNLPCTLFLLFAARENPPISNQRSPSVNSTASGGYRRHRRHDRSRRISTIGSYKREAADYNVGEFSRGPIQPYRNSSLQKG